MKIELLNVRIFLSQNSVIIDKIGNHKNVWNPYYTCYATVSAEGGKDISNGVVTIDSSTIDFTIRYCQKAAAITSTGFRVEFNGEVYDILSVDHMNFKRKSIKLKCQKVR